MRAARTWPQERTSYAETSAIGSFHSRRITSVLRNGVDRVDDRSWSDAQETEPSQSRADPRRPSAPPRDRCIDDRVHLLKQQVHAIVLALRDRDLNGVEQSKYLAPFISPVGVRVFVVLPRPFRNVCKKRPHRSYRSPLEERTMTCSRADARWRPVLSMRTARTS